MQGVTMKIGITLLLAFNGKIRPVTSHEGPGGGGGGTALLFP